MRFAQEIGQIYNKIEQTIFLTLKVNAQKCGVNFKKNNKNNIVMTRLAAFRVVLFHRA